jgi:hypothetical protein
MESSPLKYLDNDVSQMLCKQVRSAREEEARRFHDDLFHYGEKFNGLNHNFIVNVYDDMMKNNKKLLHHIVPGADTPWHPDSEKVQYMDFIDLYFLRMRLEGTSRRLRGLPSMASERATSFDSNHF